MKKNFLKRISLVLLSAWLYMPTVKAAIFSGSGNAKITDTQAGVGFVETSLAGGGVTGEGDFGVLLLKYINFILPYLALAAFLGYVVAGAFYVAAFGNEDMLTKSKKILIYSTVGLILVIVSYTIVNLLTTDLVDAINAQ